MKCLSPRKIIYKVKNKFEHINNQHEILSTLVPCGKCPHCIRQITMEWVRRIEHEISYNNGKGYFVTLTLDEPFLSINGLEKRKLQLYFKRLRKATKSKISYYACGEYGETNYREHYHAIIIGLKGSKDIELINDCWNMGFVDIKKVTYGRIKYVVNYLFKEQIPEVLLDQNPTFTLKSKGLGKKWFINNYQEVVEDKCLIINGKKCGIPRYYIKLLKTCNKIENGDILYEYINETAMNEEWKQEIPMESIMTEEEMKNWEIENNKLTEEIIQHNYNISSLRSLK